MVDEHGRRYILGQFPGGRLQYSKSKPVADGKNGYLYRCMVTDGDGNVLTATGTMAAVNPLRYRGYYFDSETGLYYLQSRYYDPELSRFINADAYASTGQGVLGNNMFAYCGNNPASAVDLTGNTWCKVSFDAFSPFDSSYIPMGDGGCGYAAVFAYHYSDDLTESGSLEEREKAMFGGTRHTRILPWEYSFLDFSDEGITLVDVSASVATISFEWDFLDLTITPFDAFSANISAGLNHEKGFHVSALAYMLKPTISFNLFGTEVSVFAYLGAVGGEFAINPGDMIKFGAASHGYGAGFTISWDD